MNSDPATTHPEENSRGATRRFVSACFCGFIFLAALIATAQGFLWATAIPHGSGLEEKMRHWHQHKDRYNAVFVGSSLVNHHFIPGQFDELMRNAGHEIRSFNLGMDGMWSPESLFVVRGILASRPKQLRFLFIEVMNVREDFEGDQHNLRALAWHDWHHTRIAMEQVAGDAIFAKRLSMEKWRKMIAHLRIFAERSVALGQGQRYFGYVFEEKSPLRKALAPIPKPVRDEGYTPGPDVVLNAGAAGQLRRAVEELNASESRPIAPFFGRELDQLAMEVRAHGITPVFMVSSSLSGTDRFSDWPRDWRMMRFDSPQNFPALYDPANRYDVHHLNPAGAKEFTRLFAEQFARGLNTP